MYQTPDILQRNNFILYGFLFLLSGILVVLSIYFPLIVLPSSVIFLVFSYIYLKKIIYPFLVTGLVLCHYFIIQNDTEISYGEIAFFLLMLYLSFDLIFRNIFRSKQNLVIFSEDRWFILYLIYCMFLIPIAIFNGNDIVMFFREMIPFAIIGLYFIYREWSLKSSELKWVLLGTLIVLSSMIAFKNIYGYKTGLALANYYYEIVGVRKAANEPFLVVSIAILIPSIFYVKTKALKLVFIFFSIVFAIALVLTFTRGYWVGAILILICVFIFETKQNKKYMLISGLIVLVLSLIMFRLILPEVFNLLISSILDRFISVGGATSKDMSFLNRIAEWKSLLDWIEVNPVVGYGYGAKFHFHDILKHEMADVYYSHNLYLYLIFKTGIIGLFILMAFYIGIIIRGIKLIYSLESSIDKSITIGLTSLLIVNLFISVSSPQLIQKDSNLIVALSVLFIQMTYIKFSKNANNYIQQKL